LPDNTYKHKRDQLHNILNFTGQVFTEPVTAGWTDRGRQSDRQWSKHNHLSACELLWTADSLPGWLQVRDKLLLLLLLLLGMTQVGLGSQTAQPGLLS